MLLIHLSILLPRIDISELGIPCARDLCCLPVVTEDVDTRLHSVISQTLLVRELVFLICFMARNFFDKAYGPRGCICFFGFGC